MAGRAASSARLGQRGFFERNGRGRKGAGVQLGQRAFLRGNLLRRRVLAIFAKKLVCYDEEGFYLFDEQG